MSNSNVGDRLKAHWLSLSIKTNKGVSKSEIQLFESKYNVLFPSDFKGYFLAVNGMDTDETDNDLIRFWTLEEIVPISEGSPVYATPNYLLNAESFFLFSDYSIWSHTYAIQLFKDLAESNTVYVIGYDKPILMAKSFSAFVDLYLSNKSLEFLKT